MDLIQTDSVYRLCIALELDVEQMSAVESADALVLDVQTQLELLPPEQIWSLQYAAEQTTEFASQVETDYARRQREYNTVARLSDETGLMAYARHLILIEVLRLACLRRYESIDQAQAVKMTIRDQVEAVMLECSDAMYQEYRIWKTLLIEAIEYQEETLPHVMYIQRGESLPALLLSYQQYGTIEREQDVIKRNRLVHPSFCPMGRDIEVLSA